MTHEFTQEIEVASHLDLHVGPDTDEDTPGGEEGEVEEEHDILKHVIAAVGHGEADVLLLSRLKYICEKN